MNGYRIEACERRKKGISELKDMIVFTKTLQTVYTHTHKDRERERYTPYKATKSYSGCWNGDDALFKEWETINYYYIRRADIQLS